MKIVIAGGGIAGLFAGLQLARSHDVAVLERETAPGGKIRTQHLDGYSFDCGPNGFLSGAPEVGQLVERLGLQSELVPASASAAKRYVYYGGRLHALPNKPLEALRLSLLSASGRTRALAELFSRKRGSEAEESVHDFFARHFGRQVAERIVAPALLGISAGDARTSSLDALFPRLREMERASGSLIRAAIAGRRRPGRLTTLRGGMGRLSDALAAALGDRLRCGVAVERIERRDGGWRVRYDGGELDADAVVVAAPAYAAAEMLEGADARLAALLREIGYAPIRVCGIAFRASDLRCELDGFGFLAARGENVRILGAIYTSTLFPAEAPQGSVYLRVFMGGAADPEAIALDSANARAVVCRDLAAVLGIAAEPVAYHEILWPSAIPQYSLGHVASLRAIDARLAQAPGLALTGNAYRGIGVTDTLRDAAAVAERLALPR